MCAPPVRALGPYQLLRKIGSGGMAEVWSARRDNRIAGEKYVAIKILARHVADNPRYREMFVSEAKISLMLNHANIVTVFDVVQEDDECYMVMELLEGMTLSQLVRALGKRGDKLPLKVSVYIIAELLRALAYAHGLNSDQGSRIVHRDVSPQNVMVSTSGEVKLMDFGIARFSTEETSGSLVKGKLQYMPPEQLAKRTREATIDLFAVGGVLQELLEGRRFRGGVEQEVLLGMVIRGDSPPLSVEAPDEIVALRDALLEPDPSKRIPTAKQALAKIYDWAGYRNASMTLEELVREFVEPASATSMAGAPAASQSQPSAPALPTPTPSQPLAPPPPPSGPPKAAPAAPPPPATKASPAAPPPPAPKASPAVPAPPAPEPPPPEQPTAIATSATRIVSDTELGALASADSTGEHEDAASSATALPAEPSTELASLPQPTEELRSEPQPELKSQPQPSEVSTDLVSEPQPAGAAPQPTTEVLSQPTAELPPPEPPTDLVAPPELELQPAPEPELDELESEPGASAQPSSTGSGSQAELEQGTDAEIIGYAQPAYDEAELDLGGGSNDAAKRVFLIVAACIGALLLFAVWRSGVLSSTPEEPELAQQEQPEEPMRIVAPPVEDTPEEFEAPPEPEPEPEPELEPEQPDGVEQDDDDGDDKATTRVSVEFVANDFYFVYIKVSGRVVALEPNHQLRLPTGTHTVYLRQKPSDSWKRAGSIRLKAGASYRVEMKKPAGLQQRRK